MSNDVIGTSESKVTVPLQGGSENKGMPWGGHLKNIALSISLYKKPYFICQHILLKNCFDV